MQSPSASASLKWIQMARVAFQVVKTEGLHSIVGNIKAERDHKCIQFNGLKSVNEDTDDAQRSLFI